jgi:hypothetical protein
VTSIDPGGDKITFGTLYKNTGDYTEIITDASASLREDTNSSVSWGDFLEDCFTPIILKPGDAIHKYYTAKLPYYGTNRAPDKDGNIQSELTISYHALMPNAETENFTLMAGTVKQRMSNGTFSDLSIKNRVLKLSFENAPRTGSSISLPESKTSPTCVQKRRSTVDQ